MTKTRRRAKPFDPAEAARKAAETRRHPDRWGVNEDALALPLNQQVHNEAETRGKVRRIRRFDCFELLATRAGLTAGQVGAVRRLQEDMAIRHRVEGSSKLEGVTGGGGSADLVTSRSIDAGRRIDLALAATGLMSSRLLLALSEPDVIHGQQVNWRLTVSGVTGEIHPHGQAAIVRAACENLRLAYQDIDKQPRRAA